MNRAETIELFVSLGRKLAAGLQTEVINAAIEANPWFTASDIDYTVKAVCATMLNGDKLAEWLAHYDNAPAAEPLKVAIVMAGNIPLVGFYDLLCTVCAGHKPYIKPSSKDSVLIGHVANLLGDAVVGRLTDEVVPDAALVTGGDDALRHYGAQWLDIPVLTRSHRSSAAMLDGTETEVQLRLLTDDIFRYNGLGCRSVSLLLVPEDYDFEPLTAALSQYEPSNRYRNNYRQRRALLTLRGQRFIDGGTFLLCPDDRFPEALAQINYIAYRSVAEADAWLTAHDDEIQCVVSEVSQHRRRVDFGQAQTPTLTDAPDGKDVMMFLQSVSQK